MFVQVIKGRAKDPAAVRAAGQRWIDEVRPNAVGFVGGTAGVADDGTFVTIARFEDEASARKNSELPQQSAWWASFEPLVDGPPTFRETTEVSFLFDGPSTDATFVQVMEGTAPDKAAAQATEAPEVEAQLRAARPDLLGGMRLWFDGGDYVEVAYFTSEEAARTGETAAEFQPPREEFQARFGEPTYLDLRDVQHS